MAVVSLIRSVFNLKSLVYENDTFSDKNGIYNRKELDFGAKILAYENSRLISPRSSPLGTFRMEERLRLSDRNSILMT